jgi:hypothetical protein
MTLSFPVSRLDARLADSFRNYPSAGGRTSESPPPEYCGLPHSRMCRGCCRSGQNSCRFVILPSMPLALTQLKRVVAALLPVSILWVFAACVLICGWERAEAQRQSVVASTVEVTETANATRCEGCPDASLLKATSPARPTFMPGLVAVSGVPASILAAATSPDALTSAFSHSHRFRPGPPLNLLPTLRI